VTPIPSRDAIRRALRAELDSRWPGASGEGRATTDERHRLVLVHPDYDGFITLEVTARADIDRVVLVPDEALEGLVTAHHRTDPLARGQVLPIDLELHPGNVDSPTSDGLLALRDGNGDPIAPSVRLTFATDPTLDCVLAGAVDGPWGEPAQFLRIVHELQAGRGSARRLARRIEVIAGGKTDPGWSRLPWRRA